MFQEESESAPGPAASPRPSPALSSPLQYGTPLSTPTHSPASSPRLSEAGLPFQPAPFIPQPSPSVSPPQPFVPQPPAQPSQLQGGPGPSLDLAHSQQPEFVLSPEQEVPSSQEQEVEASQQEPEVVTQLPEDTLPELQELYETNMPTLAYIPPAVCNTWSRVLGSLLSNLSADMSNIMLWKMFVILPFAIFPAYKRDRRTRRPSGNLT